MSWIQKLYTTYENCQSMIGEETDEKKVPLLPICHTTQKVHIEIVINKPGNFKRARVIPKNEARTIIPCTESSGGRTSGVTPHPLCDKLQYIAADYVVFGGKKEPCFRLGCKNYSNDELDTKYFKEECESIDNHLINEILGLNKKLKPHELFNELVKIPDLVSRIENNEGLPPKQKNASEDIIVKNKYKLIELFTHTLAKTITFEYLLSRWCSSEFSHAKAIAVLNYVKKGKVIKDLIDHHILFLGENGKLTARRLYEKDRNDVIDIFDLLPGRQDNRGKITNWQADAFIRWVVEVPGDPQSKVWSDKTLWKRWIEYYSSIRENRALCYVTGEESLVADQHPAKLRNDGDKAKLISSNDLSGFTFRGRFLTASQACDVSFEVTQKAHNTLRWLISRQGYRKGVQAIVAWATSGKQIPDPTSDAISLLGFDELPIDDSSSVSTAEELANKLRKRIAGYSAELDDTTGVVVMALSSATPGRMAITFYRELTGSYFLQRINEWHESCAWIHTYAYNPDTKKHHRFVGAPAPGDITEAAYGSRVDEKLRKSTVERILPCIIDGKQIPRDIVESSVRRASNRIVMKHWEWEKTISIACALYRKLKDKEDYDMALDITRKTRDYLYGRLLAIADRLEGHALFKAREKRDTNAARYMQQFAERPNKTWRQIYLSLAPYMSRLGGAKYYKNMIDEVMCKFDSIDEFNSNKPLSGEFLIGYHCQRAALWTKIQDESSDKNQDNR